MAGVVQSLASSCRVSEVRFHRSRCSAKLKQSLPPMTM